MQRIVARVLGQASLVRTGGSCCHSCALRVSSVLLDQFDRSQAGADAVAEGPTSSPDAGFKPEWLCAGERDPDVLRGLRHGTPILMIPIGMADPPIMRLLGISKELARCA